MTFRPTGQSLTPLNPAELIAAAASAAGVDPKALAAANALVDIAKQLHGGDSAAALASIGSALLAQAPPKVTSALDLLKKAADFSAATPGCFGNVGIADHPLYGQLPLDICSPLPSFMPCGIDPSLASTSTPGIKFNDRTRLLRFYSPLQGNKTLLIDSLEGTAALSEPFDFTLQLLSENASIPLKEMVAKNVSVGIRLADGSEAYINGYVDSFGFERADGGFAHYEAHVMPWFGFLGKRVNSRIFQDLTVLQVIETVFADYKQMATYVFRTLHTYEPVSFIAQYDETDEHFVSRLMEKQGLFYYFEHSAANHVMVICDDSCDSSFCPPNAHHAEVDFNAGNRAQHQDSVTAFASRRHMHASRVTLNTFDFKSPHGQRMVEADTIAEQGDVPFLEQYDGSPAFAYKNRAHGDREARRRLEEMEWQGKLFRGDSDCRGLLAGHTFKLNAHHWFDECKEGDNDFLVMRVEYEARNNFFGKGADAVYRNEFTAMRRKIPFRPRLTHKPPRMSGPQTAIVVGPAGEEIHTDQFGRVKVQFHWDRHGKHNESSSCWVRVSQPMAGQGYGMIGVPRVGQEILIEFLDGNIDRPIVTGRVFNADQPVPYALPEAAYITGLRSRSTPGGGGYNELAIHDAKGKELVNIKAQKNMFTNVGDSQMTVVHGAEQLVHVTQGAQHTLVRKNIEIASEIGAIYLTAQTEITLDCGASRMRFRPDGIIEVQGKFINTLIRAPAAAKNNGATEAPNADAAGEIVDLGDGRLKLPSGRIVRPGVDAKLVPNGPPGPPTKEQESDGRLTTNILGGGVYEDTTGQVFHGLERHTKHVAKVPAWMTPADGHPITYTFDSTGEPFWNLGGGKLVGIPIPYARPRLSDLQTGAIWEGISDGVVGLPQSIAGGMQHILDGNLTLDEVLTGVYHNSPVGFMGALADGDGYGAGHRAVGAGTGLAVGYGTQVGIGAAVKGVSHLGKTVDELGPNVNVNPLPLEISQGSAAAVELGKAGALNGYKLGDAPRFQNLMPEKLAQELAIAQALGISPTKVTDIGFAKIAAEGPIKWAVLENGDLLVVPKYAGVQEIKHSVISGGNPVLAAGEATVEVFGNTNSGFLTYGGEINRISGHFEPTKGSLKIGVEAFKQAGVHFKTVNTKLPEEFYWGF